MDGGPDVNEINENSMNRGRDQSSDGLLSFLAPSPSLKMNTEYRIYRRNRISNV